MPKILINEKDRTSPGTPGSYANYSVLIAGYMDREPVLLNADGSNAKEADKIQPDSNGVYEFSSKQDFEDTIGFSEVEKKAGVADIKNADGEIHYGKRMAHALLNMGYTVIYVPITSVLDANGITTETFWELFKDKASYDFRFVSHGLLEVGSDYDATKYDKLKAAIDAVKKDVEKFAELKTAEEYDELAGTTTEDGHMWFAGRDVGTGDQLSPYSYDIAVQLFTKPEDGSATLAEKNAEAALATYNSGCITPGTINNVNSHIAKLASYRTDDKGTVLCGGRGDCVALIELYESCYAPATPGVRPEAAIIEGIQNMSSSIGDEGAYCALTVPSVYYKMSNGVEKFPGAFHYLACFMNSLSSGFAEWYAAAGYNRGVSSYVIDHTPVKLGEIAINALEPRYIENQETQPPFACNVIANFRGSYYLWGNRTAYKLKEKNGGGDLVASHFLNIRQLCTTIKKQLYVACRRFTFDPNSDTLWFNFVNAIAPTLDAMKANQGVRDYKILKVYTDKKATLKAKIRIIPIEAVEDFDLEISLEDSFGETSAVVTE